MYRNRETKNTVSREIEKVQKSRKKEYSKSINREKKSRKNTVLVTIRKFAYRSYDYSQFSFNGQLFN